MANAMLEEDFKSSHPDLTIWDQSQQDDKLYGEQKVGNDKENLLLSEQGSSGKRTGDPRSVVIQVPPKRRKLDPSLTVRRLVHGK